MDREQKAGRLILSRRIGQRIRLRDRESGRVIWVEVADVSGGQVAVAVTAGPGVEVLREELLRRDE